MIQSLPLGSSGQHHAPLLESSEREYPCRQLSKGDVLYHLGDEASFVYLIEEGLLKQSVDLLTGKERIINLAGPGDYLGAISPSDVTYQDTVTVLSPRVVVRAMPRNELNHILREKVHNAVGIQLSRLRESLEDTELPVPARLARTFVRLGERFGNVAEDKSVHLTLPLTHDNLAAMVGAARETTTAILSEMRDHGLMQGTRGRYNFNLNHLNEFATEAAFV